MKKTVTLTLSSCNDCPRMKSELYLFVPDTSEDIFEIVCTMANKTIAMIEVGEQFVGNIPKWCPLRKIK